MDTKVIHPMMLVINASPRRLGVAAFPRLDNFASPQRLGVAAFPRLNNLTHDDDDDATDANGGSLLTIGHWEGRRSRVRSRERRR